jgi:hypothetical protein
MRIYIEGEYVTTFEFVVGYKGRVLGSRRQLHQNSPLIGAVGCLFPIAKVIEH